MTTPEYDLTAETTPAVTGADVTIGVLTGASCAFLLAALVAMIVNPQHLVTVFGLCAFVVGVSAYASSRIIESETR